MDRAIVIRPQFPSNRRVIAVSDIHGNLPFFQALMDQIRLSPEDILVLVGDMLEKGQDSLALLRHLMELPRTHTVYPLCGNCDGLVHRFFETDELDEHFFPSICPSTPNPLSGRWLGRAALNSWRIFPGCVRTCGGLFHGSGPGWLRCPPFWKPSIWSLSTGVFPPWKGWRSWTAGGA